METNIALYRNKLNLTQEKLAELADLSKNLIGMIERGETSVSVENTYKIALALNLTLETLFKKL